MGWLEKFIAKIEFDKHREEEAIKYYKRVEEFKKAQEDNKDNEGRYI